MKKVVKKLEVEFKRWGNLIPQYHKEYGTGFHSAPVEWGIYAFPHGFVESFLLGGVGSGNIVNGRRKFLKDENGKKLKIRQVDLFYEWFDEKNQYHKEWRGKYKKLFKGIDPYDVSRFCLDEDTQTLGWEMGKSYVESSWVIENEPRTFKYSGNIWCHFVEVAKRSEILAESGGWILVDIRTYKKLLKKYCDRVKYDSHISINYKWYREAGVEYKPRGRIGGYPLSNISKDWFEVFIEDVTNNKKRKKR
jgi:hypothetical protein